MDAGFQSSMTEIKNELSQIKDLPDFVSINIGPDYLKEAEEEVEDEIIEDDLPPSWMKNARFTGWPKARSRVRARRRF